MKEKNINMESRRKKVEGCATFGLLLVCAGLIAPFASTDNATLISVFKWIYTTGALIYTIARVVNVNDPGDSMRLRRLRRMEMWAGICFCVGAGFWFYNSARFAGILFSLPVMNNTIVFTLAGAMIQVVASWMIAARMKKERSGEANDKK